MNDSRKMISNRPVSKTDATRVSEYNSNATPKRAMLPQEPGFRKNGF